jgi:membrane-bound ClpP family serine protease
MGIVELDGARWRARSHRAAGIAAGDPIEVLEVSGVMLEVGPPQPSEQDVRD